MKDLSNKSKKEFFKLNSWNIYCESKNYFDTKYNVFHQASQNILEYFNNFISYEIDRHFDKQLEKIEKSLGKFDPNILDDLELKENKWTNINIDDFSLDQLVQTLNSINLDFINLDQKTSFLLEKINTIFSTLCQTPMLKFSRQNLVKMYNTKEAPNLDIEKVLNIEPKRSSSFLNAKSSDVYIDRIKNESLSNSYFDLDPLDADYQMELINIFEKVSFDFIFKYLIEIFQV